MNTPDKIYIPGKWLNVPSNHFDTEDSPGATEYIRKDDLLEWAKNWEKIGVSEDFAYAIETLIKHINSFPCP